MIAQTLPIYIIIIKALKTRRLIGLNTGEPLLRISDIKEKKFFRKNAFMKRAAIIIGVKKTGGLHELQAALDGADQMKTWAENHGFTSIALITDEKAPVTVAEIKKAVNAVLELDKFDQLFIYFAGHGVNLLYNEYWLLSGAPVDGNEAINVSGSIVLAKYSGIPHVVFISDACRTAPEGIQGQGIKGSEIFQNLPRLGIQKSVDIFYATLLGEAALEVEYPTASKIYKSIYTEELIATLSGKRPDILCLPKEPKDAKLYLRPHPLKRHLTKEVPKLIFNALGENSFRKQTPDAEVLSDEFAFVQAFDSQALDGGETLDKLQRTEAEIVQAKIDNEEDRKRSIEIAYRGEDLGSLGIFRPQEISLENADWLTIALHKAGLLFYEERKLLYPRIFDHKKIEAHNALHSENQCGFLVKGGTIRSFYTSQGYVVDPDNERKVFVNMDSQTALNVMIELRTGRLIVVPGIKGFICVLSVEKEELRNVAYEPARDSWRWGEGEDARGEVRTLRNLIAASVHEGVFRIEGEEVENIAKNIRSMKGLDPTLAVYAAYSFHRLGLTEHIIDMERYLIRDVGTTLFDVAMLTETEMVESNALPGFPMLAQGWSLLTAFGLRTIELESLQPYIAYNSLWTVFNPQAKSLLLKFLGVGQ